MEITKEELFTAVDESVKKNIEEIAGPLMSEKIADMVAKARAADIAAGRPSLSDEAKNFFVQDIQRISKNEKAAYLTVSDQTGGYLIPMEVHNEIMRIASTTGIIVRDARNFGMTDVEIPIYTGSVMQGAFVGEDQAGSETQNDLGIARLKGATWMNIIRLSNKLIAKANVNIAEWLMALVAEGLAYRLDREGFMGGTYVGSPFVGLLGSTDVTVQTLATGKTGFNKFDLDEASIAIGSLPTSIASNAAFYFHRDVWAQIRIIKDGSGRYIFNQDYTALAILNKIEGIKPVGEIMGYPVYTTDVLPAFASSAISTKFGVFGNIGVALARGENGPMQVLRSENAVVAGVSTFERAQTAMRFDQELALAVMLPAAAVVFKTSAS